LKQWVEIGAFREITADREKPLIHPKLMKLLTIGDDTFAPYSL
jgi:hypothetical protein